jgi:hypothetical protein
MLIPRRVLNYPRYPQYVSASDAIRSVSFDAKRVLSTLAAAGLPIALQPLPSLTVALISFDARTWTSSSSRPLLFMRAAGSSGWGPL